MKKTTLMILLLIGGFLQTRSQMLDNYAGKFTGTQFVSFPNHSALNPSAITLEAWVKVAADYTYSMCIVGKNYASSYYFAIAGGNKVRFCSSGWNKGSIDSDPLVQLDTWTHVAATYDGTIAKLYVNGVLNKTALNTFGPMTSTSTDVRVGRDREGSNPDYGFRGQIDEVRMWNRALSAAEIQNRMYQSLQMSEQSAYYKDLILSVPFNFNESFTTADYSSYKHSDSDINGVQSERVSHDGVMPYTQYNTALSLNGSDAYLALAHQPEVFLQPSGYTIEMWVYFNQIGGVQCLFDKHNASYTKGIAIAVNGSGNLSCRINGSTTNSNQTLVAKRWYHIAVTQNAGSVKYYINGTMDKSFTDAPVEDMGDSIFIGKRVLNDAFLDGLIDEVKITLREKSLYEIRDYLFVRPDSYNNPVYDDTVSVFSFEGNTVSHTSGMDYSVKGLLGGNAHFSEYDQQAKAVSPVVGIDQISINMRVTNSFWTLSAANPRYYDQMTVGYDVRVDNFKVFVAMQHTNQQSINVKLYNAEGDTIELFNNNNDKSGKNLVTVFSPGSDNAMQNGSYLSFSPKIQPVGANLFVGKRVKQGNWYIEIQNTNPADSGIVYGWGLEVEGPQIKPTIHVSEESKTIEAPDWGIPGMDSVLVSAEFLKGDVTIEILGDPTFDIWVPDVGYVTSISFPREGDSFPSRYIYIRYMSVTTPGSATLKISSQDVEQLVYLSGWVSVPELLLSDEVIDTFTVSQLNTSSQEFVLTIEAYELDSPDLHIDVKAPFEISLTSGSDYTHSLSIPAIDGTVSTTQVFIRYRPEQDMFHTDSIIFSNAGLFQYLTLNGRVEEEPTGLQEVSGDVVFTCYPNPASSVIHIETDQPLELVQVIDLQGKVLQSVKCNGSAAVADIEEMPEGFYLVRVYTSEGVATRKLLVRR